MPVIALYPVTVTNGEVLLGIATILICSLVYEIYKMTRRTT